jgi:dolichol-phosphate mannosyltransferase
MNKVLVCIPTYNEADNIVDILNAVKSQQSKISEYKLGVVVIDDTSPDGTGEIVEKYIEENPDFEVYLVTNKVKAGLGRAYIVGFKYAIAHDAFAVLEMDADFSHNPDYIPEIVSKLTDYDYVVGSRYTKNGGVVDWPFKRRFISWGGNMYSKFILLSGINDLTGGFNLYKTEIFKKVDLDQIKSNGFSFQIELKYKVKKAGFKGTEVPIIFKDREKGKSKFSGGIFKEAFSVPWKLRLGKM